MLHFNDRVLNFEHLLNDTDDQIIEYIQANFEDIAHMSVQSLAANMFTVPNTIIRLTRKLGYDGFSHMKTAIKEELRELEELDAMQNLKKTHALLSHQKIQTFNMMIHQSSRVIVYGIGDSAIYCEYLMNGLRTVNKKCEFYLHRHNMLTELETLTSKDLLIFISVSGETSQLIELAHLAKQRHVRTVAITHLCDNTLQRESSYSLYFSSPPIYSHHHNITDPTPIFYLLRHILEDYWKSYK